MHLFASRFIFYLAIITIVCTICGIFTTDWNISFALKVRKVILSLIFGILAVYSGIFVIKNDVNRLFYQLPSKDCPESSVFALFNRVKYESSPNLVEDIIPGKYTIDGNKVSFDDVDYTLADISIDKIVASCSVFDDDEISYIEAIISISEEKQRDKQYAMLYDYLCNELGQPKDDGKWRGGYSLYTDNDCIIFRKDVDILI